jgi:hypothetical protein
VRTDWRRAQLELTSGGSLGSGAAGGGFARRAERWRTRGRARWVARLVARSSAGCRGCLETAALMSFLLAATSTAAVRRYTEAARLVTGDVRLVFGGWAVNEVNRRKCSNGMLFYNPLIQAYII